MIKKIIAVAIITLVLFTGTAAALKNFGEYIGEYKGVIAYSNGPYTGTPEGHYQCTDYVKHFYTTLMDTSQWYGFDAIDFYTRASERNLIAYSNGGFMPPHPDDILVYSGGTAYGHVAIITGASKSGVNLIEQNVNRDSAYASQTRSGNYIPNRVIGSTTLYPKGWVRKPEPITVASPDGGESIRKGTFKTIQWGYTGSPGTTVDIDLIKGSTVIHITPIFSPPSIGSNNRGSYSWWVTQATGNDYKIRIKTNTGNYDYSNGYFSITS